MHLDYKLWIVLSNRQDGVGASPPPYWSTETDTVSEMSCAILFSLEHRMLDKLHKSSIHVNMNKYAPANLHITINAVVRFGAWLQVWSVEDRQGELQETIQAVARWNHCGIHQVRNEVRCEGNDETLLQSQFLISTLLLYFLPYEGSVLLRLYLCFKNTLPLIWALLRFYTAQDGKSDVWLTVHRNSVWIRKTK